MTFSQRFATIGLTMRCTRRHRPPFRVHYRRACMGAVAGELGR